MLEIRNLTHSFNKKNLYKNVNFAIRDGEILGLFGRSGVGKSTIAKFIMGLNSLDSGEILLDGKQVNLKNLKSKRAFYRQIQIVFQDSLSAVNPRLCVGEIIQEPLIYLSKMDKKQRHKEVCELLKKVNLSEEFYTKSPQELSGGELGRVCIARALAIKPRFVILDESLSSLDAYLAVEFLRLIKELKNQTSFLLISHDLRLLRLLCDRALELKNGEILQKDISELYQAC
ncbi:MAG: dipeptide/oligopeptide/nickel ABC transporter ATP-binding protein [Campylobacter sp.]|nr:dipeptide/oligopeptide/nickel ABC transporter ATP-binding protein [Campylobacter sp.]